ncbi:NAD(P)H-dependent oxidoreductase [Rhodococcus rhodnii]|uniref:NADPH-dependent FMN reductase n=2 Tax=Rhodococcus rhodnii TaxID=38312 RepID=R7WLU9_9NOCA|nr:NAD(P)H-dependent oxidoreductase [Rhodococcus rhodnii]EOM76260.1 NADPH-dependent FMN reductase [Rhodococcus rhodnii LMG 5362]TXG90738.1 NAD(P)H-dependent oxidoreductase [Rhodococcus rhodnii]
MANNILVLVGSLRTESINRKLAEIAGATHLEDADLTIHEGLADLPFYNEDLDVEGADLPAVRALRAAGGEADGFLLVTPEYNGTIPAVLKNAIDWLSRPYGAGAIKDKPVAIISSSISPNAAKWAHDDTVKAVGIAGGKVVEDASLSIGETMGKFAETHPRDDAQVVGEVEAVVRSLVEATGQLATV